MAMSCKAGPLARGGPPLSGLAGGCRPGGRGGQHDHEAGAATRAVFAGDLAAMPLGDGLDERQPQADAAMALAGTGQAIERFEDPGLLVVGYARSLVCLLYTSPSPRDS